MNIRRANERGHADYGWLDTHHSFSFAHYYDPAHMGFRALRVINDDRVTGGAGFPPHPHRDMEIISYVVEGALEHRDSAGNGSVIYPGEVQLMSAGTGIAHSEYNHSQDDRLRFLQIWLVPEQRGLAPGYQQRFFGDQRRGALRLVASRDGRDESLQVNQDVDLYASLLDPGDTVSHELAADRHAWLQVVNGTLQVGGQPLAEGDGIAISEPGTIEIQSTSASELLLFDLA